MKRDWEIIRELLQKTEDSSENLQLKDFSEDNTEKYSYHVELLIEAELVSGEMKRAIGRPIPHFTIKRLTWEGHEFLDSIRSDTVWSKTKSLMKEKALGMSFNIIKTAAIKIAGEMI